jgi:hypothetical protein
MIISMYLSNHGDVYCTLPRSIGQHGQFSVLDLIEVIQDSTYSTSIRFEKVIAL